MTSKNKEGQLTRCHDCGAPEGFRHVDGCDMERCYICGGQTLYCQCPPSVKIPYIRIPVLCALCGKKWPEMFRVSDHIWQNNVPPALQDEVLCRDCYDSLCALWKNLGAWTWHEAPQWELRRNKSVEKRGARQNSS